MRFTITIVIFVTKSHVIEEIYWRGDITMKLSIAVAVLLECVALAPASADVCQTAGEVMQATGAAVVGVPVAVTSWFGLAAVEHSSGAYILSNVGRGGAGYLSATLGGAGATALGIVSSPVVVGAAAATAVAGVGLTAYCYLSK
jgi:hypothetical protein